MRVHASVQQKNGGKNYGMAIAAAVIALIVFNAVRGANDKQAASASSEPSTKMVYVAKAAIAPGVEVKSDLLAQENRSVSTLPDDVVTKLEQLNGRFTAGPIPAGYPVALSLLTTVNPADPKKETAADATVAEAEKELGPPTDTVGVTLNFSTSAPRKGSRIALSIQSGKGRPALVADEAWVEASQGKSAQVRVPPERALFLEEARQLGTFSYFEIGQEGQSPFAGAAIDDIATLRERLDDSPKKILTKGASAVKQTVTQALSPSSFSSYAWSRDRRIKYGIDKDGKIYVIERNGSVTPLHEYNFEEAVPELPTAYIDSSEQSSGDAQDSDGESGVHTGLEPLMSLMSSGDSN